VQDGVLDHHQTVDAWMPSVPRSDRITVEQLLRHTSGLFNYTHSTEFLGSAAQRSDAWSPDELLGYATDANHLFPPGTAWAYSQHQLHPARQHHRGRLRPAAARGLPTLDRAPLGLDDTFLDGCDVIPDGFVPGFGPCPADPSQQVELTRVMDVSAAWAAGAIVSTAGDLLRFIRALFAGELVDAGTLTAMTDFRTVDDPLFPLVTGYGTGLVRMRLAGEVAYGHLGNIPGYSGLLAYFPDRDLQMAVLTNQDYRRLPDGQVNVEAIASACHGAST
jgi:D-alanyl-D-alanine carboxypeptidase